jgi:alkylhydroperoxidase/carboxymuconolactone decarboxylase family protein YurZ
MSPRPVGSHSALFFQADEGRIAASANSEFNNTCLRRIAVSDEQPKVSSAFQTFMREAPQQAQAWMAVVQSLDQASALDKKTEELAYLAVMAVLRLESGIPFHVQVAKQHGASREEVISAILVGLPAAGHGVTQVLPAAIAAYDAE